MNDTPRGSHSSAESAAHAPGDTGRHAAHGHASHRLPLEARFTGVVALVVAVIALVNAADFVGAGLALVAAAICFSVPLRGR